MGTISDKLTYLNTTKGLIKDTINLTGAGITNDTFRSYANKLKLGLINALNDNGDTIYSNLEKVSGKGSNLSLTPTYEAPMRNREIYGNTSQNGTPTPTSPIPIQSVTGEQNVLIQTLPSGYTPVEYIEASGTQYIDTGFLPSTTPDLIVENVFWLNSGNTNDNCVMGGRKSAQKGKGYKFPNCYNGKFEYQDNIVNTSSATGFAYDTKINYKAIITSTNVKYYINDTLTLEESSETPATTEPGDTLSIFAMHNNTATYNWLFHGRLYSSKIWEFGQLVRDFVPCIRNSDNEVGLYDRVGNTFYSNGGTGTFTYGQILKDTYEVNLGKNLLQNTANSTSANGIIYAIDDKGGILANGTATATSFIVVQTQQQSPVYEPGTYTVSLLNEMPTKGNVRFEFYKEDMSTRISQNDATSSMTITLNEKAYLRVSYMFYSSGAPSKFYNIIQVEKGNVVTPVQPYFTPIELNKIGDYEDSIKKSTGKNLFDKYNANILSGISVGSSTIGTNVNAKTLYIPIKGNTTYTIQKIVSSRFRIATTNEIPANGVSVSNYSSNDSSSSATITTSTGNKYLCIYFYITSDTITEQQILDSIMINEGSTALPYEPYGKVWYIEKKITPVNFDGSENWVKGNVNNNTTDFRINSSIGAIATGDNHILGYFDKFIGNVNGASIDTECFWFNQNGYIRFRINNTYVPNRTVEEWGTWLSSNNISGCFVLDTPTYTEITNTELIEDLETLYNAKSKNGTTNIVITSNDLPMIMSVNAIKGES